ncbi:MULTISPECIES: acyl carrier protein [unclassified Lentimonas]|uniref:acyl carrier protein n=1 Tax=unclassified Lentimonas TaxID=2630993 RepID=UPI00138A0A12|nr:MULTISPECIES: acyl carrier protein [unclassified Lentimonas]
MISTDEIRTKLVGYPETMFQHYEQFQKEGNADDLSQFIIELIRFIMDSEETSEVVVVDATNLRDDLGVDSITIAEVVFLLEDVLEIEIDNEELLSIATFGELKAFIISKLS